MTKSNVASADPRPKKQAGYRVTLYTSIIIICFSVVLHHNHFRCIIRNQSPCHFRIRLLRLFNLSVCVCPPQVQSRGVLEQSAGGGHPSAHAHGDRVHLAAVSLPGRAGGHRVRHGRLSPREPNHTHLHAKAQGWLHGGTLSRRTYRLWIRESLLGAFACTPAKMCCLEHCVKALVGMEVGFCTK